MKPGTLYRLGVTAVNDAGRSHLYYSAPIMTTSLTNPGKIAAIVVPVLLVTGLAIVLAIYFYRKRDEYLSQSKNTQIAGDSFTPVQRDGLENAAFSMDKVNSYTYLCPVGLFAEKKAILRPVGQFFSSSYVQ